MSIQLDDTIVAIASPPGASPRGIIRLSGPGAAAVLSGTIDTVLPAGKLPTRFSTHVTSTELGSSLAADVMWWPTKRSYTGQPMAEFHVIGSPPILEMLLTSLLQNGARAADRGEFTMRAFLNGRIDLLQAEAVLGVIDAADHDELQSALTQLGGGLTGQLHGIRQTIVSILGDLEAGLDFVEEDIEFITRDEIVQRLADASKIVTHMLQDSEDRLPAGYRPRVVLAGLPNAGKSTLFNRLANKQLAIESDIAGTTRDYLSTSMMLNGTAVELIDTAGQEGSTVGISATAQELGEKALESADLIVWCESADLTAKERTESQRRQEECRRFNRPILLVVTCADRLATEHTITGEVSVSALRGDGIDRLRETVARSLDSKASERSQLLATTTMRCRDSMGRTNKCLKSAIEAAETSAGDEITAINLREALHQLRVMLGETWTDDILDHIFSSFCIGK